MLQNSRLAFFILLLLSGIGIAFLGCLLPYCPTELCLGTTYAAYALQQGHTSYPAFVASTLKEAMTPAEKKEVPDKQKTTPVFTSAKTANKTNYDYSTFPVQNNTALTVDLISEMKNYKPPKKQTDAPQILIVHTHATESFSGTDNRSTDKERNMIAVGKVLKDTLTQYGFCVLHDQTLHDYPNYNGSYVNSAETISGYLKKYPSIEIVLDLHRDGIVLEDGTKVPLSATRDGQKIAKLMLVVGTDTNLTHPAWRENLKFAAGLHASVEQICPGAMRPLSLRKERFNQQLTPCTVILEIGTNGNTLEEAKRSALLLADAFYTYIK